MIKSYIKHIYSKFRDYIGLVLALLILCLLFTLLSSRFLSVTNILNVMRQISVNAILAYGMTFVMLSGGIDLSIGSMVSFSSIFCAALVSNMALPVYLVVIMALVIGGLLGLVNGLIISKTGIWPFIVTLATSLIFGGLAYAVSNGTPIRVMNQSFNVIGTGSLGFVSFPVIYMFVLLLICYMILHKTRLGRRIYAVGGNPEAAFFAGINILKVRMIAYMICAILASFTGIFLTARMYTGQPTLGSSMVNDAIASTVVGGTSMAGGKGRIVGTLLGAMLIGIISNGMNLLGLSSYLQDIVKGFIILGAVYLDSISTKKLEKKA